MELKTTGAVEVASIVQNAFPPDPQAPPPPPKVYSVFDRLRTQVQDDPEYAWAIHCNVAMPILDTRRDPNAPLVTHRQANEMAANVMQHLFGVDIRINRNWRVQP